MASLFQTSGTISVSCSTPRKINISPERQWLEHEISFWNGPFLGDMLIFEGVLPEMPRRFLLSTLLERSLFLPSGPMLVAWPHSPTWCQRIIRSDVFHRSKNAKKKTRLPTSQVVTLFFTPKLPIYAVVNKKTVKINLQGGPRIQL